MQKELNEVNTKVNSFINEIKTTPKTKNSQQLNEIWSMNNSINMVTKCYTKYPNGISKSSSTDTKRFEDLPDRVFIKRNSLLTEMFKINHIRTIRHVFISIMIILALQIFFKDLMEKGR